MRQKRRLILVVITLLIGACGQRGPLYLPEQAQTNQESPEPEQRSTSENGQSESNKTASQSNNAEDSP